MLRQARIIAALAPTDVPVPAVVATDDAEPAWFAMQLVEGESLEPVLDDPAVAAVPRRGADAPGRRDPAGTARRTPRQGAGRRRRRCLLATSWPAGHARWPPFRRTSCRTRTGCTDGSSDAVPARRRGDAGARRLPARQPDLRRHRAGRPDRLGDLERRRPARRAGLVPGLRRRLQLPRRRPRGRRDCPPPTSWSSGTPRTAGRSTTSPGSTRWAATRWPRSWATTCAGTSKAATTTPTRNACPTPSSRLIATGLSIDVLTHSATTNERTAVDFEPSARTRDLLARLQVFMDEHVYPAEAVYDAQVAAAANPHEQPQVMRDLQAKARELGLWNLFMTHGVLGRRPDQPRVRPADGAGRPVDHRPRGHELLGPRHRQHGDPGDVRHAGAAGAVAAPAAGLPDPVGVRDDRARRGELRRHATSPRPSAATATSTSSTAASGTPPASSTRTASWSSSWASPIPTGRRTGSRA